MAGNPLGYNEAMQEREVVTMPHDWEERRVYQDGYLYATQYCTRCGVSRDVICEV